MTDLINRFNEDLQLHGMSNTTIKKYFLYNTLKREWTSLKFVRPEKEKKLPVILSRKEVKAILNHVQFPHHRACPVG